MDPEDGDTEHESFTASEPDHDDQRSEENDESGQVFQMSGTSKDRGPRQQ